jgi:hypothetical protein
MKFKLKYHEMKKLIIERLKERDESIKEDEIEITKKREENYETAVDRQADKS